MRTSTILGISISLATGILVGWTMSNAKPEPMPKPANDSLFSSTIAYVPTTYSGPRSEPTEIPTTAPLNIQQQNPQLERAGDLLDSGLPHEALAVLAEIAPSINLSSPSGKEWLRLLVDVYAATDDKEQLLQIYSRFPSSFNSNELAALAIADIFISQQNTTDYDLLRNPWISNESKIARWTFLDAQEKIIDGKPTEAIALLQSKHFKGKDETDRLVRLAALFVATEPKRAWNYLSEASQQDPANPDIRTFRASVGEMLNRSQSAHSDYIVAVQNDPENPYRREQLADFYLRTKQYPQALKILQDTMSEPSLDSIWSKTLFWSRITTPVNKTWKGTEIPDGSTKDFVAYLNAMPDGIFWNEAAFAQLPDHQRYLDTLQETFWLQLIADLKKGQESQAMQRLTENSFSHDSWAPDVEKAVKTLIEFRLAMQSSSDSLSLFPRASDIDSPKELLALLANLSSTPPEQLNSSIPLDLHDFLLSKEAFVIPFLAINWNEAAIQMHALKEFPGSFPGWIAASFTEALNQNRGTKVALEFAADQKSSPALSLLVAELALDIDDKQTAFNALKGIYTSNDAHGRKAALLLGQFLMENNNPQDAKKAILSQPELAHNVPATELLARIAAQDGELDKANALYVSIEAQSSEAKSFLARKAFADKQWSRARQLTEALLKEYPDSDTLASNLKKIAAEEKKQGLSKQTTAAKL